MSNRSSFSPAPAVWTMYSGSASPNARPTRRHSFIPGTNPTSPPPYRSHGRTGRRHSQLPAYSQAITLDLQHQSVLGSLDEGLCQEHEFHLNSGTGGVNLDERPWATLKVIGRNSTSSSQKMPKFYGGDNINGHVELDLDKPQTINAITLSLRGRFITSYLQEGSCTFLNQTITIWNKDYGDPHLEAPSPLDVDRYKKSKFNAKLQGRFSWPFSFNLPTETFLPSQRSGGGQKVVQTPQSFLEQGVNANIEYQLVLHITHGLFRPNSKLQTRIFYTPTIVPGPASLLRQQAYLHGGFLFPPSEDSQGWHALPPKQISHQSLDILCTLYIAQPLSYTRGTVIPCFVTLSTTTPASSDLSSLFLSPTSAAYSVILQRRTTYLQDASQALTRPLPLGTSTHPRSLPGYVSSVEEVTKAAWWKPASNGVEQSATMCSLEGEIHLPIDLQPSCEVGFFFLEYTVSLVAKKDETLGTTSSPPHHAPNRGHFRSLSWKSSSQTPPPSPKSTKSTVQTVVVDCPVQIATFHQNGPLPTPFTVPPHSQRRNRSGKDLTWMMHRTGSNQADDIQEVDLFTASIDGSYKKC